MSMNISPTSGSSDPELMMDINTTPLIDVMLVLLVMLIITIPIQLHAVNMDMPVGTPPTSLVKPDKVQIDIDEKGVLYWQGLPVSAAELEQDMVTIGQQTIQPEVHIRPDKNARYAVFANVIADARRKGLKKIAVIGSEQFAK
jgi:biopolymer transport protein ExbD